MRIEIYSLNRLSTKLAKRLKECPDCSRQSAFDAQVRRLNELLVTQSERMSLFACIAQGSTVVGVVPIILIVFAPFPWFWKSEWRSWWENILMLFQDFSICRIDEGIDLEPWVEFLCSR